MRERCRAMTYSMRQSWHLAGLHMSSIGLQRPLIDDTGDTAASPPPNRLGETHKSGHHQHRLRPPTLWAGPSRHHKNVLEHVRRSAPSMMKAPVIPFATLIVVAPCCARVRNVVPGVARGRTPCWVWTCDGTCGAGRPRAPGIVPGSEAIRIRAI